VVLASVSCQSTLSSAPTWCCQSGSPGHKIGHIGGIVELPENFDVKKREDWIATKIVDCSYQGINRCNNVRNMGGWFGTGALFVVPNMVP